MLAKKAQARGRKILCIIGICAIESSCCGSRSFKYGLVPGYLMNWKGKKDKESRSVSEVEPITDETTKDKIAAALKKTQNLFKPNIELR
jgi:hypothetical protein